MPADGKALAMAASARQLCYALIDGVIENVSRSGRFEGAV